MKKLEPRGKSLKAFRRLKNNEIQVNDIREKLIAASGNLKQIIDNENNIFRNKSFLLTEPYSPDNKKSNKDKQRSMIGEIPNRIELELKRSKLKFYIDFTIDVSNQYVISDVRGNIIYGASRTICFVKCLNPDTAKSNDCGVCDRIARCDKLEDKPLIKLVMDRDGMLQAPDKFGDELWVFNETESLLDLHYRVLDHIYEEAFYWMNENILP